MSKTEIAILSKEEIPPWLREQYWSQKKSLNEIAKTATVSESTILYWMRKHNIPTRGWRKWSQEELEVLKKIYRKQSKTQILQALPNRTWVAIQRMANLIHIPIITEIEPINAEETKKAYLAGLLDGEGAIMVHMRKDTRTKKGYNFSTDVSVSNTDEKIVTLFNSFLNGNVYVVRKKGNWRQVYRVHYNKKEDIAKLLKALLPYLQLKRREAELVIKLCESRLLHPRGRYTGVYTFDEIMIVRELFELRSKKISKGPNPKISKIERMLAYLGGVSGTSDIRIIPQGNIG